ncbi:Cys-tRNA(Pro) deacylase [Candidatus Latescibacterota bacterium]
MKKKPGKTNAVRLLEKNGIPCELRSYRIDEHDLSAEYVARAIGLPPEQVFKTLVVSGEKTGIFLACIPTDAELDVKELAGISGNKKVELVPVKDIPGLTGYVRGGVSPAGTKKPYPVYMDESAYLFDVISLSAGVRGCQMLINPHDLVKVVEVYREKIKKYGKELYE